MTDCYNTAEPGEPKFILLGRDPMAAVLVNLWAVMRRIEGDPSDTEKIVDADRIANEMAEFAIARGKMPIGAAGAACALAAFAEMIGAVVTITQQPRVPFAMGNYHHAVTVREKRALAEPMMRSNAQRLLDAEQFGYRDV